MTNTYDIAIIGAGVTGTAIAHLLSHYNVSLALLEKEADISFGVSKANSGIIHAGFHHKPHTLKSQLELKGNLMFEQLEHELHFPFKRCGIIVAAFSSEQMKTVSQLYDQGIQNGVHGLELCGRDRILSLERTLNHDAVGGLYAPTGGIIEPYRFIFAMSESAQLNGTDLLTSFKVHSASYNGDYYTITSESKTTIQSRYVINAAGLFADDISKIFGAENYTIKPRKGEYLLFERGSSSCPDHVIFPVPTHNSKGTLVIPTVEGTMMIGPTADECISKSDVTTDAQRLETIYSFAQSMVSGLSKRGIITQFAGLRPAIVDKDDFYIESSKIIKNFIHVAGIQSPGLTAAPAIAHYVKNILKTLGLQLVEKNNFSESIPAKISLRHLSYTAADEAIAQNTSCGKIICRCETISEAEIIEAISKGHTTLDGIKFYTRAGMGRCQGGFCTFRIIDIISRITGMSPYEITKRGHESTILKGSVSTQLLESLFKDGAQ
jgi:glycerol-3-phosphate dehydrogenase